MVKVALRGLLAHKSRLFTTFLAVASGVAFIAGVLVLTDTMNRAFDDLFADVYRDTDAVVRSSESIASDFGGDVRGTLDAALLDEVRAVDGVAAADGSVDGFARIIDADGDPVGDPAMGAPTLGGNWTDIDALNPFVLSDGEPPSADDEIVIDRASADKTDYEVGDTVRVQTQTGVGEYTLAGIARFGTADSPGGSSFVLWTIDEAQKVIGQPGRYSSIGVEAEPGVSQDAVRDAVQEALTGGGVADVEVVTGAEITEESQSDIKEALSFVTRFFLVFALIALFVGSFVIYNSFSIIVAQRTREVALLRAIGARRRQVRRAVAVEAVVIGLLGAAIGFVLGLGVAVLLAKVLQVPEGTLAIMPMAVAVSVVAGVIVTVGSAIIPAWRASRVPPLAAMREAAVDTAGRSKVRMVAGLVTAALALVALTAGAFGSQIGTVGLGVLLLFVGIILLSPGLARPVSRALGTPVERLRGVAGRLARENAGRNPKRTSSTAQALMIGVGLVTFLLVLNSSIRASFDKALEEGFRGDFVVDSGTFGMLGMPPEVGEQIRELPDVDIVAPIRFSPAFVDGEEDAAVGTDPGIFELLDLDVVEGTAALAPGEVVVSEGTADSEGLAIGDPVAIDFLDDKRPEGAAREATVAGIYDAGPTGGIGSYVIGLDDFTAAVPTATDAQVFVQLADGVSVAEAEPAIEDVIDPFSTVEVQSVEEYKEAVGSQLDVFLALVSGLLALAVFIAILGIANTITLSVLERTRELGLLRAVGMRRRQLRASIRWESAIISLFGTVLGLAFGLIGGWAIIRSQRSEGFQVFEVPFVTLVFLAALAVVVGLGAALMPAWRAGRMDVLDAINTE
ncbi:MAG TPA: FtsX-like permease family protein [Acidimicrobiales bacterium]|nr:FtsX-like permease family protein [Acidimicrobiales bacterium]